MDVGSVFETMNKPEAEAPPVEAPIAEAEVQPAAEPQPALEPAPEPQLQPDPVVEQPAPETPREQTVPLAVLLRERDERKQIERRNAEMEAQFKRQQPQAIPDPVDDPNGFASHMRAEAQSMLIAQRFEMSKEIATQQFGAETVEAARQWAMQRAATDPAFDMALGNQAHPLGWIVQQHKRDGLLSNIGDDPDAWVRKRAAELGLVAPAPAAVAAPAPAMGQSAPVAVAQPPRSLAAAPGSGGGVIDVPTGPMAAVGSVFK